MEIVKEDGAVLRQEQARQGVRIVGKARVGLVMSKETLQAVRVCEGMYPCGYGLFALLGASLLDAG